MTKHLMNQPKNKKPFVFVPKNGSKPAINYGISPKKRYGIQERRKKIILMINENPGITQNELADALNTTRSTISRDFKQLSEEAKLLNNEAWLIQRERVLRDITVKLQMCEDRLTSLAASPTKGTRWMEEWRKLKDMEARIHGLYAPDRLLIKEEQTFDKDQEDASVEAVMASMQIDDIIDITPMPDKTSALDLLE